jgi:hypothetical protein
VDSPFLIRLRLQGKMIALPYRLDADGDRREHDFGGPISTSSFIALALIYYTCGNLLKHAGKRFL